jgi:N-acetyl-anhydromuramyl-L-alanine amidase AmpD
MRLAVHTCVSPSRRSRSFLSFAPFLALIVAPSACSSSNGSDSTASDNNVVSSHDLASIIADAKEDGDTPGIRFVSAAESAFQVGRPGHVDFIVIHDIEGSGGSAVRTFQVPGKEASAHYVVDAFGQIVQMVREADIANHAGQGAYNAYGIGIEHAGFAAQDDYTQDEYEASAALVAQIAARHKVQIDRQHIIGHSQVPVTDADVDACAPEKTTCGGDDHHSDPGKHWDWERYMSLVAAHAATLGYKGPSPDEQAARTLTPVEALETLSLDRALVGGYWLTQCQADDPSTQISYRIIPKGTAPSQAESRYRQKTYGPCGDRANGAFPFVLNGFPVQNPAAADVDARSLVIQRCVGGSLEVYTASGGTVPCASGSAGCANLTATLTTTTPGGC